MTRRVVCQILGYLGALALASPSLAQEVRTAPAQPVQVRKETLPGLSSKSLLFGMSAAWGDFGTREGWDKGSLARRLVERLKAAGTSNVRFVLRWNEVERESGKYDWREADRFVRFLHSQGFTLVCTLEGTPDWAQPNDPETPALLKARGWEGMRSLFAPAPHQEEALEKFANEAGKHYQGFIKRWEFGNEPNGRGALTLLRNEMGKVADVRLGSDVIVYTRLLKRVYAALKRADQSNRIAIGGLSALDTQFLEGVYVNGGREAFDAVALHPCEGVQEMRFDWIDTIRNMMVMRGDAQKALWITEWGWQAYPENPEGVPEGEQARLVRSAIAGMRQRAFIEQANYATLNDWRTSPLDLLAVRSQGLCDLNLEPRHAYRVFQTEAFNAPPPLNRYRAVPLLANVPPSLLEKAATVLVETTRVGETIPKLWRGVAAPIGARNALPIHWAKLAASLNGEGATLVRIDPLQAPGILSTDPKGSLVVAWEPLDAMLETLAKQGVATVLCLSPPANATPATWGAFVASLAKRYANTPKFGVVRWEMQAPAARAFNFYEPFALALQKEAPNSAAGLFLVGLYPLEGLEPLLEQCASRTLALHSIGLRVPSATNEAANTVRRLRSLLAKYPALRLTRLLPEIIGGSEDRGVSPLALALRLIDYAPLGQPNELLSFLADSESLQKRNGELNSAGQALSLLNRMTGARVQALTERSAVRCLASRSPEGVRLLLWQEEGAESRLVLLKLAGMGVAASAGSRANRIRIFSSQTPGRPLAVTDVAPGDLELPLWLDSSEALLVEISPIAKPAFEITVAALNTPLHGGGSLKGEARIRNLQKRPQPFDLRIVNSLTGDLPSGVLQISRGSLSPDVLRSIQYAMPIPVVFRPTPLYLHFAVGKETNLSVGTLVEPSLQVSLETPIVEAPTLGQVEVAIQFQNQSIAPLSVTLHPQGSEGETFLISGNSVLKRRVALRPPSREPGNYEMPLSVESLGETVTLLKPILRVPLLCRRARAPIQIDGDLSEWTSAERMGLGRKDQAHGKTWQGPADLSGHAMLLWDDKALYFAAEVLDDRFLQPFGASELWRGDSVLLALSGSRSLPWDQIGYGVSEHEFGMALLGSGKPAIQRFAGAPAPDNDASAPRIAIVRKEGRLFYEAAIPWAQLRSITPQMDALFGVATLFSDEDGQGRGYLEWGEGLGETKRPGRFASVRFAP